MDTRPVSERLEPLFGPFIQSFSDLHDFIEKNWPDTEPEFPPNLNQTLRFFVQAMISRARAVFVLLQAGSYWESEIVLRSLLEASVRCATFARRKNVEKLLHEFWVELQASADRKGALKAAMARAIFPKDSTDRPIFEALQNPDWFAANAATNKQRRRDLDNQWSLPELIRKLQSKSETIEPVVGINAMLHSYGLQSEISHVSSKYYDLLWDRMIRQDDKVPLENTHCCRQMTDCVHLTSFCVTLSLQRLNVASDNLGFPIEIGHAFSKLVKPYQDEFDCSQGFA